MQSIKTRGKSESRPQGPRPPPVAALAKVLPQTKHWKNILLQALRTTCMLCPFWWTWILRQGTSCGVAVGSLPYSRLLWPFCAPLALQKACKASKAPRHQKLCNSLLCNTEGGGCQHKAALRVVSGVVLLVSEWFFCYLNKFTNQSRPSLLELSILFINWLVSSWSSSLPFDLQVAAVTVKVGCLALYNANILQNVTKLWTLSGLILNLERSEL